MKLMEDGGGDEENDDSLELQKEKLWLFLVTLPSPYVYIFKSCSIWELTA